MAELIPRDRFEQVVNFEFLGLEGTQVDTIREDAETYIERLNKQYDLELSTKEKVYYGLQKCIMLAYERTAEVTISEDEMPVKYNSAKEELENLKENSQYDVEMKSETMKRGVTDEGDYY